jgi:4-amino-4-deoxy-L-arabinose transferase-like glycosyltransferase
MGANGTRAIRDRDLMVLAALTTVGALLRFYQLGGMGLWLDESNSVIIAGEDFSGLVARLRLDSSPPLYYLLLRVWTQVFGIGPLAVKSLSAVFGTLLIPATYLLGKELAGRRTALWTAVLITVAPLAIYYSREVRMYSLLPLLAVLTAWFAIRYIRRGSVPDLVGYAVAATACVYTHNFGWFIWTACVTLWWLIPDRTRSWRPWVLTQGIVVLLYIPWIPILWQQVHNPHHYSWMAPFWQDLPPWTALYRTIEAFLPGGSLPYMDLKGLPWARIWSPALAIGFLALAASSRIRGRMTGAAGSGDRGPQGRALAVLLLIPLLIPYLYSFIRQPVYAVGRTDVVIYPLFLLLLVSGARSLRSRLIPLGGLVIFLVLSVFTLGPYLDSNRRADDREMALQVISASQRGDLVVCTGLTRASLEYYLRVTKEERELVSYPGEAALHLGNLDEAAFLSGPEQLAAEAHHLANRLETGCRNGRGCFVLRFPLEMNQPLWDELETRFDLTIIDPPGGLRTALTITPVSLGRITLTESPVGPKDEH